MQAYRSDKKAHPGTGHSFQIIPSHTVPSLTGQICSLPNPSSLYAPGFMVFPSVCKVYERESLQVRLGIVLRMLRTAANTIWREQICILIYVWFRINLEFVVFHQHTPTLEKGKSLLDIKNLRADVQLEISHITLTVDFLILIVKHILVLFLSYLISNFFGKSKQGLSFNGLVKEQKKQVKFLKLKVNYINYLIKPLKGEESRYHHIWLNNLSHSKKCFTSSFFEACFNKKIFSEISYEWQQGILEESFRHWELFKSITSLRLKYMGFFLSFIVNDFLDTNAE